MQIENQIALVTGAARGIGSAVAKELLRNGARHVAIIDVIQSIGEETAEKLNSEFGKGRAIYIHCDVSNPQQFEDAFKKTVETFEGLDIVINNAGIANETAYDRMIDINVTGVVRGTLLGLQYMGKDKGAKGGLIVNVSSILGLQPYDLSPVYCATKHAVIGLSRSFATPFHCNRTGVRVLTLCPGFTRTDILLQGKANLPAEYRHPELFTKNLSGIIYQMADNVAHGLVDIIKRAPNGSIWVIENDELPYEIEIPQREIFKVKADKSTLL